MEEKYRKISRDLSQKFITQSAYDGPWLDALQCMDAYGVYKFPDNSQYRGYFRRGNFHGYGTLQLAEPYGFTFNGTFVDGHLIEIDNMWFDDGLSVTANINGWSMDFGSWSYCTKNDRRYAEEQREGLQPIVPLPLLAKEEPQRILNKNYYDVKEGIYSPSSGLLSQRPAPFPKIRFVSCPKDIEWILENCRHGPLANKSIDPLIAHKIIRNNLKSELEMAEHIPHCNYDQEKNLKNYFGKLCQLNTSDVGSAGKDIEESEDSVDNNFSNSSSTCSSFSISSMDIDVHEILYMADEYDRYNLGKDLTRETPSIVEKHTVF